MPITPATLVFTRATPDARSYRTSCTVPGTMIRSTIPASFGWMLLISSLIDASRFMISRATARAFFWRAAIDNARAYTAGFIWSHLELLGYTARRPDMIRNG